MLFRIDAEFAFLAGKDAKAYMILANAHYLKATALKGLSRELVDEGKFVGAVFARIKMATNIWCSCRFSRISKAKRKH